MPRPTELDKAWQNLMALCRSESTHKARGDHPKLLKLIASDIEGLARELGFPEKQIRTRQFRAEREDGHIVRIVTD